MSSYLNTAGLYITNSGSTPSSSITDTNDLQIYTDNNMNLICGGVGIPGIFTISAASGGVNINTNITTVTGSFVVILGNGNGISFQNVPVGSDGDHIYLESGSGNLKKQSSSKKYKDNIRLLSDEIYNLSNFMKLKPVYYTGKNDNKPCIGFIAEDIAELGLNELVVRGGKDNEPESFHYHKLTSFITKIVQQQQKQLESQQQEIDALKSELNSIKELLSKIKI
jgi:hypothetical protein